MWGTCIVVGIEALRAHSSAHAECTAASRMMSCLGDPGPFQFLRGPPLSAFLDTTEQQVSNSQECSASCYLQISGPRECTCLLFFFTK